MGAVIGIVIGLIVMIYGFTQQKTMVVLVLVGAGIMIPFIVLAVVNFFLLKKAKIFQPTVVQSAARLSANNDAVDYRVTVTVPPEVRRGVPFSIVVKSENISGRTLITHTSSTLYRRGTAIEVYTVLSDGNPLYLQDEFALITSSNAWSRTR